MLFRDEISKVDPDFYIRLRESFYLEEDKRGFSSSAAKSKNTLFNDADFKDKDYYKKYPTIWHLRDAIVNADESEHFDIRLYYLVIEHIIKHRGHFLHEGELEGAGSFENLWNDFVSAANDCGFCVKNEYRSDAESLLKKKMSKNDKKKQLGNEMFESADEDFEGDQKLLAALLCGSKISLKKAFGIDSEEDYSLSFSEGVFEDKVPEIEDFLASVDGGMDLILAAKQIYDYVYLSDLLKGSSCISAAMVRNYNQHQDDLRKIKAALKPYTEDYVHFFKTEEISKEGDVFYAAYIGKAYSQDKKGRRKSYLVNQDDINKELKKLFEKHGIAGDLLACAEDGSLLPKQRGFAKGTIPQQLHHNELRAILRRLEHDFPSFAAINPDENEGYNTKTKKIERIHDFRIPYYCGPMKPGHEKMSEPFSWADSEVKEIVRPWNYKKLVNLDARASKFITRMTNECTYLIGEKVLPKQSLTYQKYMVLNELNNLKINGKRIDNETKQKIYELGYVGGELNKNIRLNKLESWMRSAGLLNDSDELSGTNEAKTLPRLSTAADFRRILGAGFEKKYDSDKLEAVVELIVVLNNEREMLSRKIAETLGCNKEASDKLSKLGYKDWGKLSLAFLKGVHADVNGAKMNILDALWETPKNLMELLGGEYGFKGVLDELNSGRTVKDSGEITYDVVKNLYCSPAVKRTVWQAIKIVQEIEKVMGCAPAKIFLEVTRGEDKGEKKIKLSRRKELIEKYKKIRTQEAKELLENLDDKCEDRDLQSKKLFLYYCQMGKCAYCGEHLDIEELNNNQLVDIDHIYPRSKTKDDSITRNLVLVHAEENREKTNEYPVRDDTRSRMHGIWSMWLGAGLITKEKYDRLTRATPLTDDELAGFISRQIVETSQSVKAIRDLIQQHMTKSKVVMVKAGNVSELRHYYGYSGDPLNNLAAMPEFIKIRELNDIHHAKDAYLNIVVGNVMNSTFTDNPYEWVRRKKDSGYKYSIRTERLFRNIEEYKLADNVETNMPEVKAWDYADSIKIVSDTMKRNDVLWTKMTYEQSGAMSDLQIVGRANNTDGILPIKNDERRKHTEKYGGYRSISGAFFALIEDVKGDRRIIQIPIIAKKNIDKYVANEYSGAKIIIPKINFKSYLKVDGFPCHLAGRTGDRIVLHPAIQLFLSDNESIDLKAISSTYKKIIDNKKYEIDCSKDKISDEVCIRIFETLVNKLSLFRNAPILGSKVGEIVNSRDKFEKLSLKNKISAVMQLNKAMACNAECGNLSSFVNGASSVGTLFKGNKVTSWNSAKLYVQSVTGIFEKEVDLKTVQPGEF